VNPLYSRRWWKSRISGSKRVAAAAAIYSWQLSGCADGLPCRSLSYATVVCLGRARVAAGRFVAMIRKFRYTRAGFSPPNPPTPPNPPIPAAVIPA
ncbi:TPA: hypothetical protein ACFJGA_001964, partial [Neisseria gonorrhoeae]